MLTNCDDYKYEPVPSTKFKKDYRRAKKRGLPLKELHEVVDALAKGESLSTKHKDHQLKGSMKDYRECHIRPDWLLVYRIYEDELILALVETGSHADLFDM
ncbi:MAG: type II toxin-antitoxin system YafQ family toxin [Coriobacteriia bacterium]|nr:type II toxin-antitoxin system YafQ family toxin [Coriobacteriia bacterium]MCL2537064.1 type II toxin-antitoxin system YafQ family toxin [Coriobacteriia bacterium]